MDVRILNTENWEKTFNTGKAIIRVGSGLSCDVRIPDPDLPPQVMQLFTDPKDPTGASVTAIALGVTIQRKLEIVDCQPMKPCPLVIHGDTICFGKYRLQIIPTPENKIIKQTPHIAAVLRFSSNQLTPDDPITGTVELSNLDPQNASQFTMTVTGLPESCIEIGPMPFIPAGGNSSIGFILKHQRTEPEPGFQTVIITISEPNAHFGETISFWLQIHSEPFVKTNFILEDDTEILHTGKKKAVTPENPINDQRTEPEPERKEPAAASKPSFTAEPAEKEGGNTAAPSPQQNPRTSDPEDFASGTESTPEPDEKAEVKEPSIPEEPQIAAAPGKQNPSEVKSETDTLVTKPDPFDSEDAAMSSSAFEEITTPGSVIITDQKNPDPEAETVSFPDDKKITTDAAELSEESSVSKADDEWEIPVFSQNSAFFDEEPPAEETIVEETAKENAPKVISIKGDNDGFI